MQGSKADSFQKNAKRSKSFDDGYTGRRNNKKQDYHRQERVKGNKQKFAE
jgi:hypothetical protein